jgi:hypothetical protein
VARGVGDEVDGLSTSLVRYEAARTALAEAHRVDEVKDIRDKAEAMAAYARQAKDQDMILWATEIKVRAERKAGAMLTATADSGERAPQGRVSPAAPKPTTLGDLGISANQSSRWQSLASMSDDHFEAAVATAKDTAGQVTTAFMLREADRHRGTPKKGKKAEQQRQELRDAQQRGVSMLCSYARLTIKALEALDEFTDEERQVIKDLRTAIDRLSIH